MSDNAPRPPDSPAPRLARFFPAAVALLLLLALLFRLWAAWQVRIPLDPDGAVVHRMTRAMAFDGARPLFFSGQAYLAPFEQALGALALRLAPALGFFAPPMATGLFSFAVFALALRLVFLADGRKTALIAGLLLLAGPLGSAVFQVAPRGGYMAIILLSLVSLWVASRLACLLRAPAPSPARVLSFSFLLGLVAGLGIWQSFLVLPALGAAGLGVLLALVRSRAPFKRWAAVATAGLAGTLLGGAPFWLYNATHALASFEFSQTALVLSPRGRVLAAWGNFVRLAGQKAAWAPWAAGVALVSCLAGAFLLFRSRATRSPRGNEVILAFAVALSLLLGVYLASGFVITRSPRYLLPAVPLLVLPLAALLSRVPAGWILALLLSAAQCTAAAKAFRATAGAAEGLRKSAAALEETARSLDADAIITAVAHLPQSLHFTQPIPLTGVRKSFEPSVRRAVELARNPLYDTRESAFGGFLAQSAAEARREGPFAGCARPTWNRAAEIPPDTFSGPAELTDDATTALVAPADGATERLEWTFPASPSLGFLWLDFAVATGKEVARVECRRGSRWETVASDTGLARWTWSGPRAYSETGGSVVVALDGQPAEAVRLSLTGDEWQLREVQFLSPAPPAPAGEDILRAEAEEDALWREVAGLTRSGTCFAGARWAANRVAEAGGDRTRIVGLHPLPWPGAERTGLLPAGGPLAVAAEGAHASAVRRFWEGKGLESETTAGGWTLFRGTAPANAFWNGTRLLFFAGTVDGSAPAPLE